ncbi:MAG: DUF4139 domain-containing protein [Steroidobacteraceae bacterium]|nr:DUF4139 domain-containing protein [Steroidobacteraceae bacterium]
MYHSTRPGLSALAGLVIGLSAAAQPAVAADEPAGTAITIYSSAGPGAVPAEYYRPLPGMGTPPASNLPGYAMVRQDRQVKLAAGRSQLRITDVAALIDPTTVQFQSLTDPAGTRVLEQNFQFDLVSTEKLMQRYVDRGVTVERKESGELAGTLLSANDGLVLRSADGQLHALREWSGLRFGELPGGLITRPTLEWDVSAKKAGEHRARISYQTGGVTWWTDYNLTWSDGADANSGFLDVGAWVSIINQSGVSYPDAKLKLVAGEVNRAPKARPMRGEVMVYGTRAAAEDAAGFEEQGLFEYHLYTLGRPTTLPNNSTKQIELFDAARKVPARKVLVYDGAAGLGWGGEPMMERGYGPGQNPKVDVFLKFRNDRASGLGIPLPAGRIRVSQLDARDGSLEFIGEDVLAHTPKDEDVRIKLGSAFDVVGERRQTDFKVDTRARVMEEAFEIKLRNHKQAAVEVVVRENLYRWSGATVIQQSQPFERVDARNIEFKVAVPKDGESVVRYRVRYSW